MVGFHAELSDDCQNNPRYRPRRYTPLAQTNAIKALKYGSATIRNLNFEFSKGRA